MTKNSGDNEAMKKYICMCLCVLVLVTGLTACGNGNQEQGNSNQMALEITDLNGREIKLEALPKRIVSLSPTNTEIIFALGAQDKLVGVTTRCDFPAEAQNIEKVGDFSGPNLEMIIKLKPDVVLAGSSIQEDIVQSLEQLDIKVISTEAKSIEDIFKSIELVGEVTNQKKNADTVTAQMRSKLAEIASKVEAKNPVSVFFVVWKDPFKTAGKDTFIDEVITLAGGKNVAASVSGWADYSREELINKNPFAIISSQHSSSEVETAETLKNDALFKDLEATEKQRIYIMSDDSIITRGGPRIVDAVEEMRVALESWN